MNPELDVNRYFTTPEQIREYNNHIKSKALSSTFTCDLADLSDFSAHRIFTDYSLDHLAEIQEPIYPNLVRVFYTNMVYPTDVDGAFRTTIANTSFLVSPAIINRLLHTFRPNTICACAPRQFKHNEHIPESQAMAFVTHESLIPLTSPTVHVIKKVTLSLDRQVLAELVQCVLLPRKGHLDTLTLLDVWVMGCLGIGVPLDIGYLICRYMHIARLHPQQSLPFASLISILIRRHNIAIPDTEPIITISSRQRISLATFHAKHWEKVDGIWRLKTKSSSASASSSKRRRVISVDSDEHTDESDDGVERAVPSTAATSSSRLSRDEQHDLLMARIDSLSTSFTSRLDKVTSSIDTLSTSLTSLSTSVTAFQTATETRLDRLEEKLDLFTGYSGDS